MLFRREPPSVPYPSVVDALPARNPISPLRPIAFKTTGKTKFETKTNRDPLPAKVKPDHLESPPCFRPRFSSPDKGQPFGEAAVRSVPSRSVRNPSPHHPYAKPDSTKKKRRERPGDNAETSNGLDRHSPNSFRLLLPA